MPSLYIISQNRKLCLLNCSHRANAGASSAFSASFRVNFVDITCRDCSYRTFIDASTASGTIFSNFVSHI